MEKFPSAKILPLEFREHLNIIQKSTRTYQDNIRECINQINLHSYLVVNINNDANTTLGRFTSASADGRKAFTSMSNGNAPRPGMDKNGPTALLNSLNKIDASIHAGAVQNLKFSREMFTTYRPQMEALLRAYFKNGGPQAMI